MREQQEQSVGDTVDASRAFACIDETLHSDFRGRSEPSYFVEDGRPMSREEAEAWVEQGDHDGFSLIRYIVSRSQSGALRIDLAAIRPLKERDSAEG